MIRYEVRHLTRYVYRRDVELGSHLAHLLPRPLGARQLVLESALEIDPAPAMLRESVDHFGNRATWFAVESQHRRLSVEARSRVELDCPPPPAAEATPPWEAVVRAVRAAPPEIVEFARPSPRLPREAASAEYARASFPPSTPILAGLIDLRRRIKRDFAFRAGATGLRTTIGELLAQRAGVCQDFSHLMTAGLRGLGLPARYVSGYLRTYPAAGAVRRVGTDVSHAWIEAWLGETLGWIGLDPTNDILAAEEHVILGWGRDFSDVSPLFGVILGGGAHTLEVAVSLTPAS